MPSTPIITSSVRKLVRTQAIKIMAHNEEPAQDKRSKTAVNNKWSPYLSPSVKIHWNGQSDANMKDLAKDIKRHFDRSYSGVFNARRCLVYEYIDKVTNLRCKIEQRPNKRSVYWLKSMVPGPRLSFIKADQGERCINILVSVYVVAI